MSEGDSFWRLAPGVTATVTNGGDALDRAKAADWADWNRRFEEAFPPQPQEEAS